jgi:glyoxylase-like metal-dependent hydrolase (beta-lactamase superfamily II)
MSNGSPMSHDYEVLAIRYATVAGLRSELFYRYGLYGEPDAPLTMDYFFWVLRNEREVVLVDTGFRAAVGRRRGRTLLIEPVDALARLGIEPDQVSRIIVSHFHYDHIGNLAAFPKAVIAVQKRELDFWTGPFATRLQIGDVAEPSEIEYVRAGVHEGRVRCIDGDVDLGAGMRGVMVGGHCPGQQIVVVEIASRLVVLTCDAIHFYEEIDRDMPFGIFTNLVETYAAFDLLRTFEKDGAIIVAGHDHLVMDRFPAYSRETEGFAVRIA